MPLIRLSDIPYSARATERAERRAHVSRAAALEAATYRIEVAPGCHGRPYFDPPIVGWVLTQDAAAALCSQWTVMPGGTRHHHLACEQLRVTE